MLTPHRELKYAGIPLDAKGLFQWSIDGLTDHTLAFFQIVPSSFQFCALFLYQLDGIMHKWANPHFDDFEMLFVFKSPHHKLYLTKEPSA